MAQGLHREHNRLYGYSLEHEKAAIEIINVRVQAVGSTDKPRHPEEEWTDADPATALKGRRDAYVPEDNAFRSVPIYDGHRLHCGQRIAGPAIIEQVTTAVVLTASFDAIVDRYGSFVLYRKGREDLDRGRARRANQGGRRMKIDPILLSVYARTFKSITDEMSISMQQTTRSPILCEAKDFVTGLYDAEGRMLEQTENLPILAFSLAPVCKYIKDYFGDEIYPGDVIFHNDVFSLGNQNNDVAVYKPVFFEGRLVAWTAVKGHQADIGGAVAGGYNPNATEVWQEGLRIPPVKVIEKGKLRKDVWELIFANIRFDIVRHDMQAEIGAAHDRRAAPRRAARQVRSRALHGAQGGAVRRDAAHDGSRDRRHSQWPLFGRGLRLLRRPPRGDEIHDPRGHRGQRAQDPVRLLAHRRADQRLRQRHVHVQRVGDDPDAAADDQSGHPAQRGHGRARSRS